MTSIINYEDINPLANKVIIIDDFKKDIKCQNCGTSIGKVYEDGWGWEPNKIESEHEEIDDNKILHTFICPKCNCKLQIII